MGKAGEEKEAGLEENFEKLEATIEKLEAEDISLEEAFTAYSQGMQLLTQCNAQIDKVEKQVLKLNEAGELEAFTNGEG